MISQSLLKYGLNIPEADLYPSHDYHSYKLMY
jgi:hypothetical protein